MSVHRRRPDAENHGLGVPVGNAFKLNLVFFDGHAETMGDLDASNPQLWLPQGSTYEMDGRLYPDTQKRFGIQGNLPIGP